jgi:hypothetical protein
MIELKKQLKIQLDLSPEKKTVHQIFFQLLYKQTTKFFRPTYKLVNMKLNELIFRRDFNILVFVSMKIIFLADNHRVASGNLITV